MKHPVIINSNGKTERIPSLGIIARYVASMAGRQNLHQSWVSPLRRNLDYSAIGRKVFLVDQLPDGAIINYEHVSVPKPYVHRSIYIGSNGKIRGRKPYSGVRGQRVVLPTFEISANPSITIQDVKRRRFNIID